MGALRPSLENVRRLELKLGQIPAIAFTAATRNEDQARTPQVVVKKGITQLYRFSYRVRERTRLSL
jgi:hypothetical protein